MARVANNPLACHRVYRDPRGQPDTDSSSTFVLVVDGEQFTVRLVVEPATGYTDAGNTWLNGPTQGYGFGMEAAESVTGGAPARVPCHVDPPATGGSIQDE